MSDSAVNYSDPRRVPYGAAVLLWRGDRALPLLKRMGSHAPGTWCPPGGWGLPHEDPAEAAAREVWEEAGITIDPAALGFLGYTHTAFPDGYPGPSAVECVTLWFEILLDPVLAAMVRNTYPARASDLIWRTKDNLPSPLFPPFQAALAKGLVK